MYFFVDTIINEKKSGIEYAIMRRLELFKMHQQVAKILTVNYDRMVASTLADDGLLADVINLFDYFQGVLDQSITPVKLTDLNLPAHSLLEEVEPNLYHVMLNHKEIQRIHLFPRKQKQIDYIEYLSTEGVVYQKDFYDVRGFLSKRNHFDIDNNWLTYEQWLNLDGQVVLECYYQIDPSNTVDKAIYQLTDNNGCVHFFDGEQAYIRYFFDTINAQFGHKNTFIFDRLFEITWAAKTAKAAAAKKAKALKAAKAKATKAAKTLKAAKKAAAKKAAKKAVAKAKKAVTKANSANKAAAKKAAATKAAAKKAATAATKATKAYSAAKATATDADKDAKAAADVYSTILAALGIKASDVK